MKCHTELQEGALEQRVPVTVVSQEANASIEALEQDESKHAALETAQQKFSLHLRSRHLTWAAWVSPAHRHGDTSLL